MRKLISSRKTLYFHSGKCFFYEDKKLYSLPLGENVFVNEIIRDMHNALEILGISHLPHNLMEEKPAAELTAKTHLRNENDEFKAKLQVSEGDRGLVLPQALSIVSSELVGNTQSKAEVWIKEKDAADSLYAQAKIDLAEGKTRDAKISFNRARTKYKYLLKSGFFTTDSVAQAKAEKRITKTSDGGKYSDKIIDSLIKH